MHAVWGADVRAGVLVGPDGRETPVLVRLSPIDATPDALGRAQEDLVELRRVVGPAILPVEQVAAVGGQLARVYAWFDGGSLRVVLDASRAAGSSLPARVAVEVAAQVARALDSGRRSVGGHVVHAGCGPEDVLLDRAGQVCVTGFVVLRPGELLSMRPGYRAPAEADPWTYMLGALLFEMLVGDTPPDAGDSVERHAVIVRRALIRALSRPGDSPGEAVGQVMRDAMSWDSSVDVATFARQLDALALRVPGPALAEWASAAPGLVAPTAAAAPLPVALPPPPRPPVFTVVSTPPAGGLTFSPEPSEERGRPVPSPSGHPPPAPVPLGPSPAGRVPRSGPPPASFVRGLTDPMGEQAPRARRGPDVGGVGAIGIDGPAVSAPGLLLDGEGPPAAAGSSNPRGLILSLVATAGLIALFVAVVAAGWVLFGRTEEGVIDTVPAGVAPVDPTPAAEPVVVPPPTAAPATPGDPPKASPAPLAVDAPPRATGKPAAVPTAPVVSDVAADPDAPTRLAPAPADAARVVVAPPAEVAVAPVPPAPVDLPGPFSVSFAAGDPTITRLEVKCGDTSAAGAPPVAIAAAPKGACKVTGLGGAAPLLTLVTLSADRAYTCFAGGARSCR